MVTTSHHTPADAGVTILYLLYFFIDYFPVDYIIGDDMTRCEAVIYPKTNAKEVGCVSETEV